MHDIHIDKIDIHHLKLLKQMKTVIEQLKKY